MIGKVQPPGGGFRGLLNYLLEDEKLAEHVSGTMLGEDARALAREFAESRALNDRVRKPVFHGSISLHPEDRLTSRQWDAVARSYVEAMGYGNAQWVAIRHGDQAHDHIHIVASRIDSSGKRVADFQERARSEEVLRGLRASYGLREVPRSRDVKHRRMSRGQAEQFVRAGSVSPKVALRTAIEQASLGESVSLEAFVKGLADQGVELVPRVQSTGRVSGVSFRLGDVELAGSSLGRPYSWGNLQKIHGVSYDAARDGELLARLASRPAAAAELAAAEQALEAIARERAQLPLGGDVSQIDYELRFDPLHRPEHYLSLRRGLEELGDAYREPRAARQAIASAVTRHGEAAYEALVSRPEVFGRLHGHGVGGLETQGRQAARLHAGIVGRDALSDAEWAEKLREALPRAHGLLHRLDQPRGRRLDAIGRQKAAQRLTRHVSGGLRHATRGLVRKGVYKAIGVVAPPPVKLALAVGHVTVKIVRAALDLARDRDLGLGR